jgi:competence protein ComEC
VSSAWGSRALPVAFVAGVLAAHLPDQLPPEPVIPAALTGGLVLLCFARFRIAAVWLLAAGWTLFQFSLQLDHRLPAELAGQTLWVEGEVADLPETYPEYSRFRFQPLGNDRDLELPPAMLVHWYRDRPQILAGQRWRLELQLKPPWGQVNFFGPDREQWLFSERIGALGTVRQGELLSATTADKQPIQSFRSRLRETIAGRVADERAEGVVRALAVADRSGIAPADRDLMVSTGTAHLLAISGLHIGLAALSGTWLARLLLGLIPAMALANLGLRLSLAGGLLAATGYAALAGWGVSTQRALVMIAVLMLALMVRRSVSPVRSYLLALCVVLMLNPLAPLSAGFWFSFLAVGALILLFAPWFGARTGWRSMLRAQAGVMIAMVPVTIGWFQIFSPVGFLANLVAIPAVSLVIVPLILAGVCLLPVSDGLAGSLFDLSAVATLGLLAALDFFHSLQGTLPLWPEPGRLRLVLATLGGFLLLLPRGLPHRWLGLFLLLPMLLPPDTRPERDSLSLDVFDVGQGTAVLLSTANHRLLYDSGPGDGHGLDRVRSAIVPGLIRGRPQTPDLIVISHGDLDHAGGIGSLSERYAGTRWLTSLPRSHSDGFSAYLTGATASHESCGPASRWSWDGFAIRALNPSPGLPYGGNDSSCVLSVRNERASVLLAGDISGAIEKRLVAEGLEPHRLLLVPHHGSETSSTGAFIRRVQPEAAVATAGLGNRFGFPRPPVRERYLAMGSNFLSTSECGGIRLRFDGGGVLHAASARRVRQRIWRWPAAADCP